MTFGDSWKVIFLDKYKNVVCVSSWYGLDSSVELAVDNMDLSELVLEPVTFEDGDPFEGSSSTPVDADLGLVKEENEDGWESSGNGGDFYDSYRRKTTYSDMLWDSSICGSSIYPILCLPLVFLLVSVTQYLCNTFWFWWHEIT